MTPLQANVCTLCLSFVCTPTKKCRHAAASSLSAALGAAAKQCALNDLSCLEQHCNPYSSLLKRLDSSLQYRSGSGRKARPLCCSSSNDTRKRQRQRPAGRHHGFISSRCHIAEHDDCLLSDQRYLIAISIFDQLSMSAHDKLKSGLGAAPIGMLEFSADWRRSRVDTIISFDVDDHDAAVHEACSTRRELVRQVRPNAAACIALARPGIPLPGRGSAHGAGSTEAVSHTHLESSHHLSNVLQKFQAWPRDERSAVLQALLTYGAGREQCMRSTTPAPAGHY